MCRAHGVRMVGPNCLGVLNTDHHMNATFAPSVPPPGKISVISQSGALCVAILDWAASQKLGLGKVISFGNKADLNEVDFIQALAEDKETNVIAGLSGKHQGRQQIFAHRGTGGVHQAGRDSESRHHAGGRESRVVAHRQSGGCGHRLRRGVQARRGHPRGEF